MVPAIELRGLGRLAPSVQACLAEWRRQDKTRRLWARDASLWTGGGEARWLGWLDSARERPDGADGLRRTVREALPVDCRHVVVLGMGGSSLCPWVLGKTFGVIPGLPELRVLDSVVPAQVLSVARRIDPARTLFIVSSKSGKTAEVDALTSYFREQAVGARFVAITDPGTPLDDAARFHRVIHGEPTIGGRFSALSPFGLIPAACMGLDVDRLLEGARAMARACSPSSAPDENPGLMLGVVLGTLALEGRDKLTLVASPPLTSLGAWIEQLVAESTGKEGKGIFPVVLEDLGPPEVYGQDRLFVYLRFSSHPLAEQDAGVRALERAGHSILSVEVSDLMDLGGEFFRWEFATAVAGSILGVNPFDQPDVEATKEVTRRLLGEYAQGGAAPAESPRAADRGLGDHPDLEACLRAHWARIRPGDYFAINAYLEMEEPVDRALQGIRHAVRDVKHVATAVGYGPRFLHSTGQFHKGGPNRGVFLQLTADGPADPKVAPLALLGRAQAQGDFTVLASRGRRILRIHLGDRVAEGLARLSALIGGRAGRH